MHMAYTKRVASNVRGALFQFFVVAAVVLIMDDDPDNCEVLTDLVLIQHRIVFDSRGPHAIFL